MSPQQVRKAGSTTILITLAIGAMSFFSTWVFNTVVENKVMFTPLLATVARLDINAEKRRAREEVVHKEMMTTLSDMAIRLGSYEIKLYHVIADCDDNRDQIQQCRDNQYSSNK